MLSLLVGLEQVAVKSGLLNHGCVDLVASSELLLEVRVAVDHTSEGWLLSVGGWLGPLVEEPHGWEGSEGNPNLWLDRLSVSIFWVSSRAPLTPKRSSALGAAWP